MPLLLIADDHPLFRAALRGAAIEAADDVQTCEAASLDEVLATLDARPDVDLVLLDLHMPGNHGLAGLAAIRAQYPAVELITGLLFAAVVWQFGIGWTAAKTWRALLNVHSARSGDANRVGDSTGLGLTALQYLGERARMRLRRGGPASQIGGNARANSRSAC